MGRVAKQDKCPICQKPAAEKIRPFCSKRCADIDLGRWLKEGYRVPVVDEEEAWEEEAERQVREDDAPSESRH